MLKSKTLMAVSVLLYGREDRGFNPLEPSGYYIYHQP
jgi:hypothetical protein